LSAKVLNPEVMVDCSHVLVFAAWDKYTAERIDTIYNKTTDDRDLQEVGLIVTQINKRYLFESNCCRKF
jgi:hypothetical protein